MKTAVVTGASYGIGKSVMKALLEEGWKVYGLSRSQPKVDHEGFVWLKCDLSKSEQIEKCLEAISEPIIDALVSNAGVVISEGATAVSLSAYEKTFSVNVRAPMLVVGALRDKIRRATIISVSSDSDRLSDASIALYCSSKAANTLYFNSLAQELRDANIYTLLPDYVDTPMLRDSLAGDKSFDWDVIIQPSDIAKLSVNLIAGRVGLESGANIIVVTEALKGSFKSVEKLYGFNADTNKLIKL